MEKTYNGWTNYATWRVNLEIFDNFNLEDYWDKVETDVNTLANWLADFADDCVCEGVPNGLAKDYARSFLKDVNWHEIAKHLLEDYQIEKEIA